MKIKNIRHTGIVVADMARSLKFYRDLLGMKVVTEATEESEYIDTISALSGVRIEIAKLVTEDGGMVELLHYVNHPTPNIENRLCDNGIRHMAFTVDEIEKIYADWSAKGVRFNSPPVISPNGYAKVAFCQDPDGVFLEVVEIM